MEHVISRADLAGSESSPSASPEPDVLEKFRDLGQFEFVASNTHYVGDAARDGDEEDEGLEFQLFATPKTGGNLGASTNGEAQKIRLCSPSLDPAKTGFVRPHRSLSYYFTNPLSADEKHRLETAALTGTSVLAHSKQPWPGSAYTWKVLHLPPSGLSKDLQPAQHTGFARLTGGDDQQPRKRTRPGKKYRIKLRKKVAATEARKDAKRAAEEAKEVAEREKRTRRNREKKVKRKEKEKARKGGTVAEEEGGEDGGDGDAGDAESVG